MIKLITSTSQAKDIITSLGTPKFIALDTETTGLNFVRKKILMLQLGILDVQYVFDMRSVHPDLFRDWFENREIVKIIQNSAFDAAFIAYQWGIKIRNIYDPKLVENIILGIGSIPFHLRNRADIKDKYSTSLQAMLARYEFIHIEKETALTFLNMTDEPFTDNQIYYGALDVEYLEPLMEKQIKRINELKLQNVMKLENRVAEVTYMMRVHGINFNLEFWKSLADKNQEQYDKEIAKLNKMTNNQVKNWGSPKQVLNYLQNVEKLNITSMTDFHSYQQDNPWWGKSKALDQLIKIRIESFKYATTYGHTWLETRWSKEEPNEPTVGPDGRIHCDFQQIINTGRFSCSKPNLQQIPNNWQGNPLHDQRKAFIPSDGYLFVGADFSGQELALMAAGSGEKNWIKILKEGKDLHSKMAELIYGKKWHDESLPDCEFVKSEQKCNCPRHKILRQAAKTIDFGLPYGKGYRSIAEDLGITFDEAKDLVEKFSAAAPDLINWLELNGDKAEIHSKAFTLPPFNRRRMLELEPQAWRRRNMGKNTPIQGSGGDMIKLAMWYVYSYIEKNNYPAKILLCIHDELLTEAREDKAKEWSGILRDLMEKAALKITKEYLIKAEPQITKYWKK